ncbi:DUF4174 domain-containing protein [Catenovulum sp. SM1970]|uniref:DUF4174 domain-containing protein n=1 Tax=Marinifaba aquimaris TaxID=2741323 RepID=UPI001571FF4F|nr:DUF4174 domain-containing protein [Marinifaba aquimaris]NTS76318.1 DUF4174 domain-containing protein [Marinifaba aquimaris]
MRVLQALVLFVLIPNFVLLNPTKAIATDELATPILLDTWLWEYRLMAINTEQADHKQLKLWLARHQCHLNDRRIRVVGLPESMVKSVSLSIDVSDNDKYELSYLPKSKGALIGLDGIEKIRFDLPLTAEKTQLLWQLIDEMAMRKPRSHWAKCEQSM